MNFGPRLDLRQSQQLAMTPQLQQAIKLLALSHLELESFLGDAVEGNPLLEMDGDGDDTPMAAPSDEAAAAPASDGTEETPLDRLVSPDAGVEQALDIDPSALDTERDTGDGAQDPWLTMEPGKAGSGDAEGSELLDRASGSLTLTQHLLAQLGLLACTPQQATIAGYVIGLLDEAGYLAAGAREIASDLAVPIPPVEDAIRLVQSLEPTGVGARDLAECLALQAREADRYDPCMARLIDNLDLLARGEIKRLKRICGVDDEDFAGMLAELRGYDPKPGLRFDDMRGAEPVAPDILLRPGRDGGWDLAMNPATLPRLVVNRGYYLELRNACDDKQSRGWLSDRLADANWLVKTLDQRQKTILKVAAEIVKQQDAFFRQGVSGLKPLTLRAVADAIAMHESTVSRVVSSKYLQCPRGTFELKYFFTSGVASTDGEGASAEAVKAQIRAIIDTEGPDSILSDDALVDLLREKGFDLARRTVAKYREAIGIGSSVQRRRQKKLEAVR